MLLLSSKEPVFQRNLLLLYASYIKLNCYVVHKNVIIDAVYLLSLYCVSLVLKLFLLLSIIVICVRFYKIVSTNCFDVEYSVQVLINWSTNYQIITNRNTTILFSIF